MVSAMSDPMKKLDALILKLKWEKDDRRQNGRLKQARRLRIVCNNGAGTVSGMLIDLSTSGARLRAMSDTDIPDEIGLELEQGLVIPCKIVYRNDADLGVKFILPS
jgi:hypothetical protein